MMKLKFKADPRWFKHKAKEAIAIAEMSAVVGMKKAVERHKFDAINEPPTVPFKTGWLRDQHITFVEVLGSFLIGHLKVSTPRGYACSLHEGISRWGTPYDFKAPGSGPKWIESKMIRFGDRYFGILSNTIISNLRRAGFR